nr:MAG TPA: hypothetical protein [Caudoviricetes sp.]
MSGLEASGRQTGRKKEPRAKALSSLSCGNSFQSTGRFSALTRS